MGVFGYEGERSGEDSSDGQLTETIAIDAKADAQEPRPLAVDISTRGQETITSRETQMELEQHLQGLKQIRGYKASGIMDFTGEMLAFDSMDTSVDLNLFGATFNDIFRAAHEASRMIGLDTCRELVMNTPKGVIVMRCSGVDAQVHFHLICVLASDGNQALAKLQFEKSVPAIMADLAV